MRRRQALDLDKSGKPRHSPSNEARKAAKVALQKRQRSKRLTWDLVEELATLDSSLPYDRAFGCCQAVEQADGVLTTHYCRCRWCIVCNRIRMAQRIDRYQPVFQEWGEVYLVTLTVPNVRAGELSGTLDAMLHRLKLCRKQIRRGRGMEYKAVRSIEVTHNEKRRDYHPHFHLAVAGEAQARALVEEWLKRWPDASATAQDVRQWDGQAGGLKELTKYCTKLVSGEGKRPPASALDVIFRALEGRHLFRPVGFDLPPEAPVDDEFDELHASVPAFKRLGEHVLWWWDGGEWVDRLTGEVLVDDDEPPPARAGP